MFDLFDDVAFSPSTQDFFFFLYLPCFAHLLTYTHTHTQRLPFFLFSPHSFLSQTNPALASRPGHGAAFNTPSHAAIASPNSNVSTPATETSSLNTTTTTPANTTAASNITNDNDNNHDNNNNNNNTNNIIIIIDNDSSKNSDSYYTGTMSTDVTGLMPAGMAYDLASPGSDVNWGSGGNDTDDATSDSTLKTVVERAESADSLITILVPWIKLNYKNNQHKENLPKKKELKHDNAIRPPVALICAPG